MQNLVDSEDKSRRFSPTPHPRRFSNCSTVLLRFLSPNHRRRNPNSISWFSPYECLRKNMIFKVVENVYGYAGITSSFVRSEFPSVDIPLNHEVFVVPKGHNAPQQLAYFTKELA
ncbi:hypothetical protein P8452_56459 [Trifolium repens]|nr:hypothetical protein P8452_56459 [Trifolium repens]